MPKTANQELGILGEKFVAKNCSCPRCKREHTFRCLPPNFKCADIICDFCGYLAQVKSKTVEDINVIPDSVLGAAWGPQNKRMEAGIYFPLFLILVCGKHKAIFYLPADLQESKIFQKRNPLGSNARRAGWEGFTYDFKSIKERFLRLF